MDWYGFLGNERPDFYATYAEAQVAAQALDIKRQIHYPKRYREDPRLPSCPDKVYADAGWMDWYDFLGIERPDIYPTYAGAQAAAQELGIKTKLDYKKRYREDPRLPSCPDKVYADAGWMDWYDFLGIERPDIYPTYAGAQAAAQELGIKTKLDYKKRYREDPRLPSCPDKVYADAGWMDWYDFHGNERPDFYPTYAEAQTAARSLGIKSQPDYKKRYRQDPRLPSCPDKGYAGAGWMGWYDFLGKERSDWYPTYAEAQAAAQALGIKSQPDYKKRYRQDPRLPSCPDKGYAGAGWMGWYDFHGKERKNFYATYAEAQAAARALGIKKNPDYTQRYREDPRLPSSPNEIYADAGWMGWYDFLDNERPDLYPTYAEAKAAARALGIKRNHDYTKRYREDPRLPSCPNEVYADAGWMDWYDFLGYERPDFYATYAEAQAAVQALGIKNQPDYKKRYREDPRLPSSPDEVYADAGWIDLYDFLGNERPDLYPTYAEAQAAAQALGIKKHPDYAKRYREDPRLPSCPNEVYADAGWMDWYDFLGNENPSAALADYPHIWANVKQWLKTQVNIQGKRSAIRVFLSDFYQVQELPDEPIHLLLRANPFPTEAYQQFIEAQAESLKRPYHRAITAFFGWLLDEHCTDADADERIVLAEFRNPFQTVLAGFADSLQAYRPNQSTKPPLGYEYILRARNFLVPNGEQVLQTRPSLTNLPHLQDFFATRADWIYVDESVIDRDDPNCIWRVVKADRKMKDKREVVNSYQIWSPVRFVALYTLLRFPLRGQQILWLDSGEADKEIVVLDSEHGGVRWEKNTGPLAGKGSKKRRPQAAVQRGDKDAPKLYVTTNKTGRQEGGYEVPWIPDDLLYWFLLLRDWQAKYNPLKGPTRWSDIKLRAETNEKILQARGTQCFLFRTDASGQPAFTTTAFTHTLPALLYAIQRPGENLASESPNSKSSNQRYISPYTPHSLRVSLITAFIADGEAPIHLISKLVGHASLVMTIYYIRLNNDQMRRTMGETEKRAAEIATQRNAEVLRTQGLQPLRHQLIATDGNRLLLESDVPNSACVVFDHGICPMSGAACQIGGMAVAERKVENLYAPVEAGYLGQKNCPRCRFFVTGVPFLGGLVALANELALEIHAESARFQRYAAVVKRLEQDRYDACQANQTDTQHSTLKQANANQELSAGKLDGLLTDYAAVNHYVQGCLKLINEGEQSGEGENGVRLIAGGDLAEVGVAFEESKTNYHLLAEICQNATIYRSANPSRAVPLIAQAIDRMAENNGLAPTMYRLDDEQKLVVANEMNRILLQRLGSWEKIDDLFSGDLMLLDIDTHEPELTRISTEIRQLLSNPNSARQLTSEASINE
ncbi:MAG: integrase [Pseudomonas sp. CO183]|nr:MAG: integrase [Pseudomonas sp. CO183]